MERKLSIALVLGAGRSNRVLDAFGPLSQDFDIKAIGLLSGISSESYCTEIPLQTFIEDQHLPGFLLGAEDEFLKADVIVASGLLEASTYQAFRHAYNNQKPFLVFCQREDDLKKAMIERPDDFQDCVNNASGFLACGEEIVDTLEFMGCARERILLMEPEVNVKKFGFHDKLRAKFREYLKVQANDLLIVNHLAEDNSPLELLAALKMLEALDRMIFDRVKLLFVGNATTKDTVKYRAVDLGLSKSILFISQDIRPFFNDLMSATDLTVSLSRGHDPTEHLLTLLESMACGADMLVHDRHTLAPILGETHVVQNSGKLVLTLRDVLAEPMERKDVIDLVEEHYGQRNMAEILKSFLFEKVSEKPLQLPLATDFNQVQALLQGKAAENLETFFEAFEDEMKRWGTHSDYRGRLLALKGQVHLKASQFEEAMSCFELCTAEESVQREAFLGLARISLFTHSNEEALAFYRKALALKPNDPEALGGIGNVYRKIGMADEAVHWLGRSVLVDTDNTRNLVALTQACTEVDDHERAIDLLEQLKVLLGNKPALVMCLGQLYFKAGNNEKGKELVDLALEITSQPSALLPNMPS